MSAIQNMIIAAFMAAVALARGFHGATGTNTAVPHSGHFIQLDQPKTVIAQVLRTVSVRR